MNETFRMLFSAIAAAFVFLVLFLLLHWHLAVCILICIGVYFGLFMILKPSIKISGIDVEDLPGGEEIQDILNDAQNDLKEIYRAAKAINEPEVRKNAEILYNTGINILSYLKENPDKIKTARRFFNYYLDTAAKLLKRCVDFQDTGLRSEEVMEILGKTADSIPVMNKAFERQFTHLMEGELLDVEADIELLNSTLKMEGEK